MVIWSWSWDTKLLSHFQEYVHFFVKSKLQRFFTRVHVFAQTFFTWGRQHTETLSALLIRRMWNPTVTGDSSHKWPVMRNFDIFKIWDAMTRIFNKRLIVIHGRSTMLGLDLWWNMVIVSLSLTECLMLTWGSRHWLRLYAEVGSSSKYISRDR